MESLRNCKRMLFDSTNKIIQYCSEGMNLEGEGKPEEARKIFLLAWEEATNDFEKCTAAHYVARYQNSAQEKLSWDKMALQLALKIDSDEMKIYLPSLYLNLAKGYEDCHAVDNARINYVLANQYAQLLPDDGYGNMIRQGIRCGIERIASACTTVNGLENSSGG
jgi:hypothetical protein